MLRVKRALFGGLAAIVIVVACNKTETAATKDAAPAIASASASAKPPAAKAAESEDAKIEGELATVTRRWNSALANRDVEALGELYGERVRLYTTDTDRAGAIKMKRAAFTAAPDYTQSIEKVSFNRRDPKLVRAEFDKKWTQRGKTSSVRGSITLAPENGKWVVVEESDVKTDSTTAKYDCINWVHKAVTSTEDGSMFVPPKYLTFFVCGPPECDSYQIHAKQLTGDFYFQTLARYEVDVKNGVVMHGEEKLQANPAVIAKMKEACAKEEAADRDR